MPLDKDTIIKCLKIIGERLLEKGTKGEILLAGGASMCLVHKARDSTYDLDAIFKPYDDIYSISLDLTDELNLEVGWLNDAVKVFMKKDPAKDLLYKFPGLDVFTVSPEYLLVMKLAAFRAGTNDSDDAKLLLKLLDIDSLEKAKNILDSYLPYDDKYNYFIAVLETIFQEINSRSCI